jgi:hypothetical protein
MDIGCPLALTLKVNISPTSAVIEILSPDAVPVEEVLVKV